MAAGNKKLKTILFTNPDGSVSEALLFPGFAGAGVAETASISDQPLALSQEINPSL